MDDFLKDNSYITIHLDPIVPDDDKRDDEKVPDEGRSDAAAQDAPVQDAEATQEVEAPDAMTAQEAEAPNASEVEEELVPSADTAVQAATEEVAVEEAAVEEITPADIAVEDAAPEDVAPEEAAAEDAQEYEDDAVEYEEPLVQIRSMPIVGQGSAPRVNPVNLDAEVDKYNGYQNAVSSSNTLGVGLVLLLFAIALIVVLWVGLGFIGDQAKEQGAQTLRDSIVDSAMQCFAIEGYYPPSLEYLQENYGLSVNEDDYTVVYIAFASNVPPTVDVRLR